MPKINKEMIKAKDMLVHSIPMGMSLTGRIRDWLDNDESRLPASCTTFSVKDSMEGRDGIEDSWLFTSHGLRNAAGVAIDLSELRPGGTDNGRGLVSSGAVSFSKFYSLINQELRRGGIFKNGAVTLFLDYNHDDCSEFINMPTSELPWAKRAVYVDEGIINHPIKKELSKRVNDGTVWLAKKQYDKKGNRIYSNVCLEVLIPSRGTCILSSVNLGLFEDLSKLPTAFAECMEWLCKLHAVTGVGKTGHYLNPSEDKQVGLGVIGLANLLAIHGVSYSEFTYALEVLLKSGLPYEYSVDEQVPCIAFEVAEAIIRGYASAAKRAKLYGMERAFAIAPTASMSYRYTDADGYTTAPEISAPISYEVDRDSDTFGVQSFEYHPMGEVAKNVGWDVQWKLLNAWQKLQDSTGLGHAISANVWSSKIVDESFIDEFINSNLKTTYYRISVDQVALDKSEVINPNSDEEKLRGLYDNNNNSNDGVDNTQCFINPGDDEQYCAACGG